MAALWHCCKNGGQALACGHQQRVHVVSQTHVTYSCEGVQGFQGEEVRNGFGRMCVGERSLQAGDCAARYSAWDVDELIMFDVEVGAAGGGTAEAALDVK